jgi:BlaI family transcriptional regulator, penicillinase repressor
VADYNLTGLQVEILNVLWARGEATVVDVREALRPGRDLAMTTVSTLLSRMERKGVVRHRTEGRQYVYAPAVAASEVKQSVVSELADVADRLFEGDVADLVTHLLAERDVDASELARVRDLIDRKAAQLEDEERLA